MLAMFLAAIDATIVGTAVRASSATSAASTCSRGSSPRTCSPRPSRCPLSGKLGDLYGRKPLFLVAVLIFVAASMVAGAAHSMELLIAARAAQGIGGGMIFRHDVRGHRRSLLAARARARAGSGRGRVRHRLGDRADARRLDHGRLDVALDLLHQPADRIIAFAVILLRMPWTRLYREGEARIRLRRRGAAQRRGRALPARDGLGRRPLRVGLCADDRADRDLARRARRLRGRRGARSRSRSSRCSCSRTAPSPSRRCCCC